MKGRLWHRSTIGSPHNRDYVRTPAAACSSSLEMAANATTALAAKTKASKARTVIMSGHCAFVAARVKPTRNT